jgi:hypothetical protein
VVILSLFSLQLAQKLNQPERWCYIQHRGAAWVIIAHKQDVQIAFTNHDGSALLEQAIYQYPWLRSIEHCVIEDRWIASKRRSDIRRGNLAMAVVEKSTVTLSPNWPGFKLSMLKSSESKQEMGPMFRFIKDDLSFGPHRWPADKGVVMVWQSGRIRVVSAHRYFS